MIYRALILAVALLTPPSAIAKTELSLQVDAEGRNNMNRHRLIASGDTPDGRDTLFVISCRVDDFTTGIVLDFGLPEGTFPIEGLDLTISHTNVDKVTLRASSTKEFLAMGGAKPKAALSAFLTPGIVTFTTSTGVSASFDLNGEGERLAYYSEICQF
jgi:hypothetical protein